MATYIGLLRAVNLGSHNKIGMTELRGFVAALGFTEVKTLLQSGNVVFQGNRRAPATIEALLEKEAAARLGLQTEFFVRTADEWAAAIRANPFPGDAKADPGHLVMLAMKGAPEPAAVTALQRAVTGREQVRAVGREAFITYPDGIGESRLTMARIERHLGTSGTGRNWNTVLKLAALAGAAG